MKRDVSTTGAAARAIGARNPMAFDCVHSRDESIRRLAAITDPPPGPFKMLERKSMKELLDQPLARVPQRPTGHVNAEAVQLDWDRVRFEGRWSSRLDVATLEGTMVPHGIARVVAPAFAIVAFAAGAAAVGPGGYWLAGIVIAILLLAMPLLAAYLGSARVAAEIELERIIGSAIGDPEKYAVRWRTWRED